MLIRQLQEVALQSTLRLKVSVFDLEPKGLAWVLLGQELHLEKLPLLGDRYEVITCPTGFERIFTYRDFHLLDQNGHRVGTSATTWMLMDLASRKMATMPDWIKQLDQKIPPKSSHLPRASYKVNTATSEGLTKKFQVGHHQLDFNGHLTNPFYVEWMLEGLPKDILQNECPKKLAVQFKREARYGEELTVYIKKEREGCYHHALYRGEEILASLQSYW